MRKFVSSQEEEICKLIIGLGQYSLTEKYQHLSIASSRWFTALSDDQKKDAQRKFQQASVDDKQDFSSVDDGQNFTSLDDGQGFSSVDDGQDFSSVNDRQHFSSMEDRRGFSSVGESQKVDDRQENFYDLTDTVSDDHMQQYDLTLNLQEDKPAEDNEQQGYVLPVDITKAS